MRSWFENRNKILFVSTSSKNGNQERALKEISRKQMVFSLKICPICLSFASCHGSGSRNPEKRKQELSELRQPAQWPVLPPLRPGQQGDKKVRLAVCPSVFWDHNRSGQPPVVQLVSTSFQARVSYPKLSGGKTKKVPESHSTLCLFFFPLFSDGLLFTGCRWRKKHSRRVHSGYEFEWKAK